MTCQLNRRLRCLSAWLIVCMLLPTFLAACSADPPGEGEASETETSAVMPDMSETSGETTEDDPFTPAPLESGLVAASPAGGLYTSAVSLTLTAPEGYTIRYTTDGSLPSKRAKKYTKPVTLDPATGAGTTVRAACFDADGHIVGDVTTHTYVKVKSTQSKLFTVMITVDEGDLSEMTDAYAEKVERPAHVEIVRPDGTTVISQDAGLRLFGGSSRSLEQKSFKLIARKDGYFGTDVPYKGKGTFAYPLFEDRRVKAGADAGRVLDRYDSFILRNGGNDSLLHTAQNPTDATLLRDGLINNFAFDHAPHVDVSLSQFAAVYINGEYYGLLDMRENQNEDYVKRVYGVDDNLVVVVKSELDVTRTCRHNSGHAICRYCGAWFYYETDDTPAAQAELNDWILLCRETIAAYRADDAAYAAAYDKLAARLDLDNFMEYMALGLYFCNTDWPHNNVKLYRYTGATAEGNPVTDGKWRFMTRDMDMGMARYSVPHVTSELDNRANVDTFRWVLANYVDGYSHDGQLYYDALYLQGLFAFCLRNEEFRADFEAYARGLASDETHDELVALWRSARAVVNTGMKVHIERWSDALPAGYMLATWRGATERIKDFLDDRPAHFTDDLARAMTLVARGK